MLPLLQEINERIECHIKNLSKSQNEIELKDLMGKFSMDALASCAFGVDSGSFSNEKSEFVKSADEIFDFVSPSAIAQTIFSMFTPKLVKQFFHALGFKRFATIPHLKAHEFFQNVVEASIKQRKETKIRRNDLVDLMIDATEGKLELTEDDQSQAKHETEYTVTEQNQKKSKDVKYGQVISTAEILLVAGYDTTGTTMSYIIYELAMHQEFQDILFEEIEEAKSSGGLSYDTIQSLPYLDAVIHETLRRHPVVPLLDRPCTKEYKLPNTDLTLKKGDLIRISNIGICFDPDIYPNPEEWNPDNFSKDNRATRNPYSFLAFSLGPRNCLAMRFALFEMKVAVSHLVSRFKILTTPKTCKTVLCNPRHILGAAKGGLWVKFEER